MGLIGVSDKAYPILAIPKKNTIQFSPMKLKANPLDKIEYERIQWEGIKKEEESKKGREARKQTKRKEKEINIKNMAKRIKNELNGGKNSITIETKNGFIRYDLDGKAHYDKELKKYIDTPHKLEYVQNINPKNLSLKSISKGRVKPITRKDLNFIENYLKGERK